MWSPEFLALFKQQEGNFNESKWKEAWYSVLHSCFPFEDGFTISPQSEPERGRDLVEFVLRAFKVKQFIMTKYGEMEAVDIFFLDLKSPKYVANREVRNDADKQVRMRFDSLDDNVPSIVHGVSAFGTRACFYNMDRAGRRVSPRPVSSEDIETADTCPESWWETDILTEAGYDEFMRHVNEAKESGRQELQRRIVQS